MNSVQSRLNVPMPPYQNKPKPKQKNRMPSHSNFYMYLQDEMPIVQCMLSTCLYKRNIAGRASLSVKCFSQIFFLTTKPFDCKVIITFVFELRIPNFQDSLSNNVDLGCAFAIFWENKGSLNLF